MHYHLLHILNGGLFTENSFDTDYKAKITDSHFEKILKFLERYNFTISEDSPLDKEVAVDPEMIGKVYESLVNVSDEVDERGEAGIFYTPRTEIDLMCRLTLVDNLANYVGENKKSVLYQLVSPHEKGIAIVGSSNLTLAGVSHNTELNVVVQGNDNHAALKDWFKELWDEAQDFDESLMQEMKQSWALAPVRPYDIYMKTIYALVKDRLEGENEKDILFDSEITRQLADFQKVAVRQAVQIIRDYGGVFVSDVVGLGKSYIGAAIVKHFEQTDHARPLIICPAPLTEMWERYNEVYELNARVLSMGYLREDDVTNVNMLLKDAKYKDRDLVLIDESHNFRYPDTQRYKLVQQFMSTGRRCCFLTATPRNKSAWDVYYQIKLFHQNDKTDLPIDPPDLKQAFSVFGGAVEKAGDRESATALAELLVPETAWRARSPTGFTATRVACTRPRRGSRSRASRIPAMTCWILSAAAAPSWSRPWRRVARR